LIEVKGEDHVSFLHNLCTNDLRNVESGRGCEAFFTTVQGKTLLHALMFSETDSIVIASSPGHANTILPHLDKYLIREDVSLIDRSDQWREIWIAGPAATGRLGSMGLHVPSDPLSHAQVELSGVDVVLRRVPLADVPCFVVQMAAAEMAHVGVALAAQGIVEVEQEIVELARIEAGFPSYGRDITIDNLPQEVARDRQAISFTKGCYLGQETVARIDALGHVNRQLVRLKFSDNDHVPPPGTELSYDEKVVGKVTSSCWSPASGVAIALAYVGRRAIQADVMLQSESGTARIVASN
jgi:folate-binding protein YgfZ